jgi:hypothetical protein
LTMGPDSGLDAKRSADTAHCIGYAYHREWPVRRPPPLPLCTLYFVYSQILQIGGPQ